MVKLPVVVLENGVYGDECLDDNILCVHPHLLHVVASLSEGGVEGDEPPLTPGHIILNEVLAVLVDRVVC